MRTTLTLDEDVAAKLREEMRRSGLSFKELVNNLLRRAMAPPAATPPVPFKVEARNLGLRPGLSYDNVWELIEETEGPFHR